MKINFPKKILLKKSKEGDAPAAKRPVETSAERKMRKIWKKRGEEQQRNLHAVAQHTKWKNNILSVAWQNYILPSFECNWALSFKNISLQKFIRKRPKIATKWVTMATVTFLDLAPKNMQISTRVIVLAFLDPTKSHVICIGKCEAFNVFLVTSWSQIC